MRFPFPVVVLALAACGAGNEPIALATRADSAGVEIVTNQDPLWSQAGRWEIVPQPLLEIGPRNDDPHYEFLRTTSGTILPTGELAVLVAGSQEIRIFSPTGAWLRTMGRDGEGPGEMRRPGGIQAVGDTIFVRDGGLGRLSAFSTAGAFLTSWPAPVTEDGGAISPIYRLADGSWLGTASLSFGGNGLPANGTTRYPTTYLRIAADLTRIVDTVATTAGVEQNVTVSTGNNGTITGISVRPPPFGLSSPTAARGDRFLWGDNGTPELRVLSADGTLRQILRWSATRQPITAALIAQVRDANMAMREGDPQWEAALRAQYAVEPTTDVVPFFSGINLDPDGVIWVREYPVLPTDSTRFQVFQPDGQLLGALALGPRHTVLEVGTDYLLTVWQDNDDLEHLRVYQVRRPRDP